MKIYFYVPKNQIKSIFKYGYLSARAQYDFFHKVDILKYKTQYLDAIEKYPELKHIVSDKKALSEKILTYLDWRDKSLEGSNAIYFLYQPIPNIEIIHDYIKKYRGDFLKNRVLIEANIPKNTKIIPIYHIDQKNINNEDYWIKLWLKQIEIKQKNLLWFENIPHAYFNGYLIKPTQLKIIN
jgi:hypothetical protein